MVGIRPEYVEVDDVGDGVPALPGTVTGVVSQVQDIGTYWLLTAKVGPHTLKARLSAHAQPPAGGATVALRVLNPHTCFCRCRRAADRRRGTHGRDLRGDHLGCSGGPRMKPINQKAWLLVLPVLIVRGLLGHPAADDGGELFGAGHHLARAARLRRHRVVRRGDA